MSQKQSRDITVLDDNGVCIGKMGYSQAYSLAVQRNLDLVEINGKDAVYKIMDRGKWLYDQKKKSKQNKQHVHAMKEMKFGMRIDQHDELTKINHIKDILQKRCDVRIIVEMKGREKSNPNLAMEKINNILSELKDVARADIIRRSPGNVSVIVYPE